jgi:hypothetical protein
MGCGDERPESKRLNAITNLHSPLEYRVDGVVSNMPEFQKAFACKGLAADGPGAGVPGLVVAGQQQRFSRCELIGFDSDFVLPDLSEIVLELQAEPELG